MKRHICVRCGRKRYEDRMKPYQHCGSGWVVQWYDGWVCADSDFNCKWAEDERHKDKKDIKLSRCSRTTWTFAGRGVSNHEEHEKEPLIAIDASGILRQCLRFEYPFRSPLFDYLSKLLPDLWEGIPDYLQKVHQQDFKLIHIP